MEQLQEYRKRILEEKTKEITEKFIERCENRPSYKQEKVVFETNNETGKIEGFENTFSAIKTLKKAINDVLPRYDKNVKELLKIEDIENNDTKVTKDYIVILSNEYEGKRNESLEDALKNGELSIKLKVFWHDNNISYGGGLDKMYEMGDKDSQYLETVFLKEDCEKMLKTSKIAKEIPGFYSLNINGTNVILSPKTDYVHEYQNVHIINKELLNAIKTIKDEKIEGKEVQKSSDFIGNVKKLLGLSKTDKNKDIEKFAKKILSNKEILKNNKKALIELGQVEASKECDKDIEDIEKLEKWFEDHGHTTDTFAFINYVKELENKNLEKMFNIKNIENDIEK